MVPREWTHAMIREHYVKEDLIFEPGGPDAARVQVPEGAYAATDGSGGGVTDPRLRRTGWGLTVRGPGGVEILSGSGGVPGRQTVPRAELFALLQVAQRTAGPIVIHIDASYVTKGWEKGPRHDHRHHQDLWRTLWEELEGRRGFKVQKVKAHLKQEDVHRGIISQEAFDANNMADDLAGKAAERHQFPSHVYREMEERDSLARKVQLRLATILMEVASESSKPSREERQQLAAQRAADREARLRAALRGTGHAVQPAGLRFLCRVCKTSRARRTAPRWLESQCPGPPGPRVHSSHRVRVLRGLKWCVRCGAWCTRRPVKLAAVCLGRPSLSGRRARKLLRQGRRPPGCRQWPDGID